MYAEYTWKGDIGKLTLTKKQRERMRTVDWSLRLSLSVSVCKAA